MSHLMKRVSTKKYEEEVVKKKSKFKVIKPDFLKDRASDIMEDPDKSDRNFIDKASEMENPKRLFNSGWLSEQNEY